MGRRTSRRHYSLVNFKSPVGRNHWPSCWHGSYGIIYNPPQSPQLSVDSHRVININDIHLLLWSNTENLKPTPRVTLRLGGYNDMTQQMSTVFNEVKNPRTLEGKITRSRRLLPYWRKFKIRQKNLPVQNEECRFKTRFKGNLFPIKLWSSQISGLQFGSREIRSPTKL